MTAHLACSSLSLSYGKTPILDAVDLSLRPGQITAIVGPNACGKSSLLRCLCRLQRPSGGAVMLNDQNIHQINTRDVARQIAFLPQSTSAPAGMRVQELVLRGRTPHQSPLQQWSMKDQLQVEAALAQVGLAGQGDTLLDTLSGGQLQRAWIAMVLAQDTQILLLDEPTTFLDLPHQQDVMSLVRRLQQEHQLTVAMVLHDINLAARFCDQIVALKERRIVVEGSPVEVVTEANIKTIYGLDSSVIKDPHSGLPHVILR